MPTDPRTDRIATLARELSRMDSPRDLTARRSYLRARHDLAALIRRGASGDMIEAARYRAERAQDVLTLAEHPPALV
jgi:hypothetical protein